VCIETQTDVLL